MSLKPRCHNRAERLPEGAGWRDTGKVKFELVPGRYGFFKPIMRYRWPWFTDACKSWDAPKIEDSVPAREGWQCAGCRWLPERAVPLVYQSDSGQPKPLNLRSENLCGTHPSSAPRTGASRCSS